MSIKDLAPPGVEPVDLAYAKTFLRVDTDSEDSLIRDMIVSARLRVEQMIRSSLISRRQLYTTSKLSDSGLFINHGPVSTVHSVKAVDGDGQETELWPSDYGVDYRSIPTRLCLRDPWRWSQFGKGAAYVAVELDAGYGDGPEDIPMPLRQAVLLLLAQAFEFRDSPVTPSLPLMADALLMPYRSIKL